MSLCCLGFLYGPLLKVFFHLVHSCLGLKLVHFVPRDLMCGVSISGVSSVHFLHLMVCCALYNGFVEVGCGYSEGFWFFGCTMLSWVSMSCNLVQNWRKLCSIFLLDPFWPDTGHNGRLPVVWFWRLEPMTSLFSTRILHPPSHTCNCVCQHIFFLSIQTILLVFVVSSFFMFLW